MAGLEESRLLSEANRFVSPVYQAENQPRNLTGKWDLGWDIGQVVLHGKEQLVLLRPAGRLLLMTVLDRENEVTQPAAKKFPAGRT